MPVTWAGNMSCSLHIVLFFLPWTSPSHVANLHSLFKSIFLLRSLLITVWYSCSHVFLTLSGFSVRIQLGVFSTHSRVSRNAWWMNNIWCKKVLSTFLEVTSTLPHLTPLHAFYQIRGLLWGRCPYLCTLEIRMSILWIISGNAV